MEALLTLLMVFAMLGALGMVAFGVVGMVRGAGRDPRRQNALMRWRILLQAAAIGLFLLIMALFRH